MIESFPLDASFAALADPTRRAILARLALGEATVTELAEPFAMTQPAISQHLKVLEDAGLITQRVDGARRPRQLAHAGIAAMDQWLAMLRQALEKNYDRLDGVLAAMKPVIKPDSLQPTKSRQTKSRSTNKERKKR
jgi:DNA-binding transcriptional ArsR family regulator